MNPVKFMFLFFDEHYNHPLAQLSDPARCVPYKIRLLWLTDVLSWPFLFLVVGLGISLFFPLSIDNPIVWILILPVAIFFIAVGIDRCMDKIFLLRHGIICKAQVIKTSFFNSEEKDDTTVTIEFLTSKGEKVQLEKTISLEGRTIAEEVTLIYLPWDPNTAEFVVSLNHREKGILNY